MSIHFIINEKAGDGKGVKVWSDLQAAESYPHNLTRFRCHATELARQIAVDREESLLIVIIGGMAQYMKY
ncbi:diacylglycerol kinase family protein [Sporosarcina obsidiansis]|uniref:hypothetical protein n=1 Tax=Sporosarcina obsidiansis TaxID=2660748 RepID=UPI00129AB8F4|nr:hypothetical protein [Sporosarcina obsidiansis]